MKSILVALTSVLIIAWTSPHHANPLQFDQVVPDFTLDKCILADSIRLSNFSHKPILLYFYDAGDASMMGAYPYLNAWKERYFPDSLVVIGIHCPQYEPVKQWANASTAVSRGMVKVPIAMDFDLDVYKAYGIERLPTFLLIRPGLRLFYSTSDSRPYLEIEKAIQRLLRELNPKGAIVFPLKPLKPEDDPNQKLLLSTPKIDLGYTKATIVGCDSTKYDKFAIYRDSGERQRNKIYLDGRWKVEASKITCQSEGSNFRHSIRFIYSGKTVWVLLAKRHDIPVKIYIKQDNAYLPHEFWGKDVKIDFETKYPCVHSRYDVPIEIVNNQKFGSHQLQIIVDDAEVSFYYFYFEPEAAP